MLFATVIHHHKAHFRIASRVLQPGEGTPLQEATTVTLLLSQCYIHANGEDEQNRRTKCKQKHHIFHKKNVSGAVDHNKNLQSLK